MKSRILNGFKSKGFAQLVTISLQLISVPIFISFWGVETYGVWIVLMSIPAYLALSDIGFSTVTANHMTMAIANDKKTEAIQAFQSTWILISSISILIFSLVCFLSKFIDIGRLLNLNIDVNNVLLTLVAYVLICLQGGVINAGYRCDGHFAIGVFFGGLIRLIENSILLALVVFGFDMLIVALSLLISRTTLLLFSALYLLKKSEWLSYGYKNFKFSYIKKLIQPSFMFMLIPLTNAITIQGFTLLTAYLLTPAAVVELNTVRTLTRLGIQLIGIVNQVFMPELSILLSQQKIKEAKDLLIRGLKFNILLSINFFLGINILGEYIIKLWTSGVVVPDKNFMLIMASSVIFHSICNSFSTLLISINKHGSFSFFGLLSAFLSILTSYLLVEVFGLNAIALGILLFNLLLLLLVLPKAIIILEMSYINFLMCFFKRNYESNVLNK